MKSVLLILTGLTTLGACTTSFADEASEARMRDMLKQAVLQQRAAQDENTALKIQLDTLKAQLSQQAAKPAVPTADKVDDKLKQKVAQQEQAIEQLNRQLAQARQQSAASLKSSTDQLGNAQQVLRQVQAEKAQLENTCRSQLGAQQDKTAQLESRVQGVEQQLADSEQKNQTLVSISQELLARYKQKGVLNILRSQEPLTGLSRVKLETLTQEYSSKIRQQTLSPAHQSGTGSVHE